MHYIIICSNMKIITDFQVSKVHFTFDCLNASSRYINLSWKCISSLFCQLRCQGMYYSLMDYEVNNFVYISCVT